MPAALAAKLRDAGEATPSEERRVITMLFCDVKGSTAAAEHMDPERWQEIINGAFEHMIEPVYRYEGVVARLMGDGLLAFFGAPIAHEDDPERAVLAGLEIVERVDAYCRSVDLGDGLTIAVRVGINTGMVMVGRVGTDHKAEYTAMGNAVNIAARMEQTAEPGTVQVADATYSHVAEQFEWEPLGPTELKGQSEPIVTYRPLRALRRVRRSDHSPLVGRAALVAKMTQTVERLDRGIGSVTLLTGDAGLGKTRLTAELRDAVPDDGWIEAAATSYETAIPYAFIRRLVSALYAKSWTPSAFEEIADPGDRRILEHLIVPRPGEADPSGFGDSLATSLRNLIGQRPCPLVVVCDSLQWADDASLAVLADLAATTTDEALALVCALRPEPRTAVASFRISVQDAVPQLVQPIALEPLTDAEMAELLRQLAPDLGEDRVANLVPRLDGNPLFAEELTRSLAAAGSAEVPNSLLALLVAQLDRLDDEAKRAAQLASVLGEDFGGRLLEEMGGGDAVADLLRSRVLVEAARVPERRLAFRHGLMREAAYSTVLHRDRLQYHRLAAEAIERVHADDIEGSAELLARQFRLADDDRAVRYEIIAGRRAQALSAAAEAIELLERAREGVLAGAEVTVDEGIALYISLGRAYELAGRSPDARDLYEELLSWGKQTGNRTAELAALPRLGLIHSRTSPLVDPPKGWEYAKAGVSLAEELGDTTELARLAWVSGHLEDDSVEKAAHFEHALDLLRDLDEPELLAFVLNDLYLPYGQLGRMDEALDALYEARRLWEQLGNKAMLADSLTGLGLIASIGGEIDDAGKYYAEAGAIGAEIGSAWLTEISHIQGASLDVLRGNFARWWEVMEGYASRDSFGLPDGFSFRPLVAGYLALGRYRDVLDLADVFEPTVTGTFTPWWADLFAVRAIAHLLLDEPEAANDAYLRAHELDGDWVAPLVTQSPLRMTRYLVTQALRRSEWDEAAAAVDRYEATMEPLRAKLDLARAAVMRADIAAARGEGGADLYRDAADALAPISPWLSAEATVGYARLTNDADALAEARGVVERCLEGLPEDRRSELGAVRWLAAVLDP